MTISFSGLASGLDTSSWIQSLTALKQAKVTVLQEERESVVLSKNTLNSIKSFFSSFRSTIERITDTKFNVVSMDLFAQNIATSANLSVLTATATAEAQEGKYEIKVDKLASNTQAVSKHDYTTTIVETTTATNDSLLKNLGVKAGNIEVTVDGKTYGMTISSVETIGSFARKLQQMGVDAKFNEQTGIFSMDISASAINDVDHTGIVAGLHLNSVSQGFQSGALTTERLETVTKAADGSTKLKDLGVNAGTLTIKANDDEYEVTLDDDDTMQDLLDALRGEDIDATLEDGVFSINNAIITDQGSTNIIDALGLSSDVVSETTQTSNPFNVVINSTEVAISTADKLNDIDGVNVADGDTVEVLTDAGVTATVTLSGTSTVGQFIAGLNAAGLQASLKSDGSFLIKGGKITGGTFDAINALGLTENISSNIVNSMTSTEPLYNVQLSGTVGNDLTSAGAVFYTKTLAATGSTTLAEVLGQSMVELNNIGTLNADGTVSGGNVVMISTAEQLIAMQDASQVDDTIYRNVTFVLENDITLASPEWKGINLNAAVFDGNGYNIELNISNSDTNKIALFNNVSNSNIRELSTSGMVAGQEVAAIAVSLQYDSKLTNCSSNATLLTASTAGGLVLEAYRSDILNNAFNGIIQSNSTSGNYSIGGIICYAEESNIRFNQNSGYISVSTSGTMEIGGIAWTLDSNQTFIQNISAGAFRASGRGSTELAGLVHTLTGASYYFKYNIVAAGASLTASTTSAAGLIYELAVNTALDGSDNFFNSSANRTDSRATGVYWGTVAINTTSADSDLSSFYPYYYNSTSGNSNNQIKFSSLQSWLTNRGGAYTGSSVFNFEPSLTIAGVYINDTNRFVADETKIQITQANGEVAGYVTITDSTTLDNLIDALEVYGFVGNVNNGVLELISTNRLYVDDAAILEPDIDLLLHEYDIATRLGFNKTFATSLTTFGTLGYVEEGEEEVVTIQEKRSTALMNEFTITDTFNLTSLSVMDSATEITSGTYSISTTAEMVQLATMTNNGLIGAGATFVLANDIDMSSVTDWVGIGKGSNRFQATFDGNGHEITKLKISNLTSGAGLFGRSAGTIKNLVMRSSTIVSEGTGGIVVGINSGTVENCTVVGSYIFSSLGYAGGIVGQSAAGSAISACQVFLTDFDVNANAYGGGIAGYAGGTVTGCYVELYGNVDGDTTNFGGIVGESYGTIRSCHVGGSSTDASKIAGVFAVNTNSGDVVRCTYSSVFAACTLGGNMTNQVTQAEKSRTFQTVKSAGTTVTVTSDMTIEQFTVKVKETTGVVMRYNGSSLYAYYGENKDMYISGGLAEDLGFNPNVQLSDTSEGYSNPLYILDTQSKTFTDGTVYTTIDTTTTLNNFGVGAGVITFANGETVSYADTNDLASVLDLFETKGGITSDLTDGKLTLDQDNDNYILSDSGNLLSTLGIDVANLYSPTYTTIAATTATQLKDLHYADGTKLTGYDLAINGNSISFSETDTLQDVFNTLNSNGLNASFNADGTIAVQSLGAIDIDGTLGDFILGGYSSSTDVLKYTVVQEVTDSTALSDLGVEGKVFEIRDTDGNVIASTNATGTLNETFAFWNSESAGNIFAEVVDGVINITTTGGYHVTGELCEALGIGVEESGFIINSQTQSTAKITTTIDGKDFQVGFSLSSQEVIYSKIREYQEAEIAQMIDFATVSGDSTILDGVFAISSKTDLEKLSTMTNNGYIQGGTFILVNDIDLRSVPFTPIGDFENKFKGTFDGNGYAISNLVTAADYAGLFGYTDTGSIIKNVSIIGGEVAGAHAGGLVGFSNSHIKNCYASLKVSGTNYVGGLAGTAYGTIEDSYSEGLVTGSGNATGGLVGYLQTTIISSGSSATVKGNKNVGGLVGNTAMRVVIQNSFASGLVSGTQYIGGLAGMISMYSNVSNCYATGSSTGNYNGGFGGTISSSATISNCAAVQTDNVATQMSINAIYSTYNAELMDMTIANGWKNLSTGGFVQTGAMSISPATPDTTFGDIGLSSTVVSTVCVNNSEFTMTINADTKISDYLSWLDGRTFDCSFSNSKITINGDLNAYFMDQNDTIDSLLGFANMTVDLGLTTNQLIGVVNKETGVMSTIEITTEDTLVDLTYKLNAVGIDVTPIKYLGSECISLKSEGDVAYVNSMTTELAEFLQMQKSPITGDYIFHTKIEVPIKNVSSGKNLNTYTTYIADASTTLSQLGCVGSDYIEISDGTTNFTVSVSDAMTVDQLLNSLSAYGTAKIENGMISFAGTGNNVIVNDTNNFLDKLKINTATAPESVQAGSEKVESYTSEGKVVIKESESTIGNDTKLSDVGVTAGQFVVYKNGVKYTANVYEGDTIGNLRDTLATFGVQSGLIKNADDSLTFIVKGVGDTYLETSASTTASNVVDVLFPNEKIQSYNYSNYIERPVTETIYVTATEETTLATFDKTSPSAGILSLKVDGIDKTITITNDETFGSFIDKLGSIGVEAFIADGKLVVTNLTGVAINTVGTTSKVEENLGLAFSNTLADLATSTAVVQQSITIVEDRTGSVANYADHSTKLELLNISSGSLSVYRNGQKATVQVNSDETFEQLRQRILSAFSQGDVDLTFEDGYMKLSSTTEGVKVDVGSSVDTSNITAICGLASNNEGVVKSSRELYRVNGDSKLVTSSLFVRGDIKEGTFTIGDATFEITENTTLNNIISQINSSAEANATAYWDSIDGKFVIKSRGTGATLINIEAGTSNFTDLLGLTESTWNPDGTLAQTRLVSEAQEVGDSAKFSINGTEYTSTSNTITSDISRIKGVTIDLKGISNGQTVTLTIEKDCDSLANAMEEVVDAYNDLIKNVDKEIAQDGKLSDQSTLKMIRNQVRNLMTSSLSSMATYKNLAQIGIATEAAAAGNISTANISNLTFDKAKFTEAFKADGAAVKYLLVGDGNSQGLLTQVENLVEQSLTSTYGYFSSAENSYATTISRYDEKIKRANATVERYKARLEKKFQSMDLLISQMQNQYSSFLGV